MQQNQAANGEQLRDTIVLSTIEKLVQDRASRELAIGQYLLQRGKLAAAELCFDHAIRETDQKPIHIAALVGKSEVYRQRGSMEGAHELLDEAEESAQEISDRRLFGLVCQQRAEVISAEGYPAAALDKLREAERALNEVQATEAERAQVALKLGAACQQLMRLREALAHYVRAEDLAQNIDPAKGQPLKPVAVLAQGQVLFGLGKPAEALDKCTESQALLGAESRRHAHLLKAGAELRAAAHEAMGQPEQAIACLEEALEHAPTQDPCERAPLWAQLASKKYGMAMPEEARAFEAQALEVLQQHDSPQACLHLVQLALMRGNMHVAQAYLGEAQLGPGKSEQCKLELGQRLGQELLQAHLDLQKGAVELAGERAAAAYEELAPTEEREAQCDQGLLTTVLEFCGTLERLKQNLDQAESLHRQALDIAQAGGMRSTEAGALANLARVASARLEHGAADELYKQAIEISQECGAVIQAYTLAFERAVLPDSDPAASLDEKRAMLREMLSEAQELECLPLELSVRVSLAILDWQDSRSERAIQELQCVVEKAGQAGMFLAKHVAQGLLGTVLSDVGQSRLAEEHLTEALTGMEQRGLEIEARQQFLERFRDLTGFPF